MILLHSPDGGNRTRLQLRYRKGLGEKLFIIVLTEFAKQIII